MACKRVRILKELKAVSVKKTQRINTHSVNLNKSTQL